MAKFGEHAAPRCPVCGHRVRVKLGTKRTTPTPLFQCPAGAETHPEDGFEWTPAMLAMLAAEKIGEGER